MISHSFSEEIDAEFIEDDHQPDRRHGQSNKMMRPSQTLETFRTTAGRKQRDGTMKTMIMHNRPPPIVTGWDDTSTTLNDGTKDGANDETKDGNFGNPW